MSPFSAPAAARPLESLRWLFLLAAAVLLVHLLLVTWVADSAFDLEGRPDGAGMKRLSAMFVAELRPTAPQLVAKVVPLAAPGRAAMSAAPAAASAAASAARLTPAPEPAPAKEASPSAAADTAPLAAAQAASASAPVLEPTSEPVPPSTTPALAPGAAALGASAPSMAEWPLSTQLTYKLSGNFRGPVEGQASVQWLREGSRYQVHLEVSVGPSFAPLVSRRMSSDGEIGPEGLTPRRYEEETRMLLRDPRRLTLLLDGPVVRLANGSEVPRPEGLQDSASQFVQMTWLFTTQPDRLRRGQSVDLMLALPRRVEPWTYDVLDREVLQTPAGLIEAVHVRPRRPAKPGDLTAEMWTAPSLQYLPVRIVIRQDSENWVDLLLDRLPRQAAEAAPR